MERKKAARKVSSHQSPQTQCLIAAVLTVTPEKYVRAVISLSRRYSSVSVFPGNNYIDIGEWMLQDRSLLKPAAIRQGDASTFASKSGQPHDLVVVYHSGENKWNMRQYTQEQHEAFSAASLPAQGSGQIIFIRGFISPTWVSVIGSKYNIDPEFFRRHMDFLCMSMDKHSYSSPSLASSSNNLFRLCVSTLLHRDDFGGQDLQSQRLDQSTELGTYKTQQLGSTRISCGDSMVREYSTVCSCVSVIEQWISLYVAKTAEGWAGKPTSLLPRQRPLIAVAHSHRLDGPRQTLGKVSSGPMDTSHRIQGNTTAHSPTSS